MKNFGSYALVVIGSGLICLSATSVCYAEVYGKDNRTDLIDELDPKVLNAARSVGMIFLADDATIQKPAGSTSYHIQTTHKQNDKVCSSEPFASQPAPRHNCSGALIGPELAKLAQI